MYTGFAMGLPLVGAKIFPGDQRKPQSEGGIYPTKWVLRAQRVRRTGHRQAANVPRGTFVAKTGEKQIPRLRSE